MKYFVNNWILFFGIFLSSFQFKDDLRLIVRDKQTSEILPFTSVSVCGEAYVTDANGVLFLKYSPDLCNLKIQRMGYVTFDEEVSFKGKNNLVILLQEEFVLLNEVVVNAGQIKPKNVKEVMALMLENFDENHLPEKLAVKMEEAVNFQFGYEPILERSSQHTFNINEGQVSKDRNEKDYSFSIINQEKNDRLESFLRNAGLVISQLKEEYGKGRSDAITNADCNPLESLGCYLITFFPIDRNLLFNPISNSSNITQTLDHFGFINKTFLNSHGFKIEGKTKILDRDCFKIKISSSSKSIPVSIGGNPVKNLYVPEGYIYIDDLNFAILKLEYRYVIKENKLKSEAFKNEFNSGPIYFENIIDFKSVNGKWLPEKQFIKEKDRVLKIFNVTEGYESGYLDKHIVYSYD